MEIESIGVAIKLASEVERLGIIGILSVWIIYREIQHYRFNVATTSKITKTLESASRLADEMNAKTIKDSKNEADMLKVMEEIKTELNKRNEIDASIFQYTKDTCVGVKVRLDKLDDKIDEIDKKIIALK